MKSNNFPGVGTWHKESGKIRIDQDVLSLISMPRTISIGSHHDWSECQLRWLASKLPSEDTSIRYSEAQLVGRITHAILEALYVMSPQIRTTRMANDMIDDVCDALESGKPHGLLVYSDHELWAARPEDQRTPIDLLRRHIKAQIKLDRKASEIEVKSIECDVAGFYDGAVITGRIDRVDQVDGGLVIRDYKTGKVPSDFPSGQLVDLEGDEPMMRPLQVYGALLGDGRKSADDDGTKTFWWGSAPLVLDEPVESVSLDFTANGQRFVAPWLPEVAEQEMQAMASSFKAQKKAMQSRVFLVSPSRKNCAYCPINSRCKYADTYRK